MFIVYILYSVASAKTYCGYTNNITRRLLEHNFTETSGFTMRYRPWIVIYKEVFDEKRTAMAREKYFKTGKGRDEIKVIASNYLQNDTRAVSAAAEMD